MNIVFMGTSPFAIPALEALVASDHKVLAVVTQPDRKRGRGLQVQPSPVKQVAEEKGLYLYQPEDVNEYEFVRELRALSPDCIAVVAYGQKLGNEILTLPRFYTLNIHPSLLPRYRGPAPVARAILNGERHTGVAIIKVVKKMDAGPILGLMRVEIPPEKTTPEMEDDLSKKGADLLIDVLGKVHSRTVIEIPQNERDASYARKFDKRDGRIDWRKSNTRILNFVRALQPFPGAFTFHNRRRLGVHRIVGERANQKPRERPGTVVALDKDKIRVSCGDGYIEILELQPESRKKMQAEEFLRGAQLKEGDRLG